VPVNPTGTNRIQQEFGLPAQPAAGAVPALGKMPVRGFGEREISREGFGFPSPQEQPIWSFGAFAVNFPQFRTGHPLELRL